MNNKIKAVFNTPYWYMLFIKTKPFLKKYLFFIICLIGLMWYAVYTNYIIGRLQKDAILSTRTYVELINNVLSDKMGADSKKVALENVIEDFDIPVIITDNYWRPIIWKNIFIGPFFSRREIAQNDTSLKTKKILEKKIGSLKKRYDPRVIYGKDRRTKMGYLVFGNSYLISGLAWMPFFEIVFILIFSSFVYFALHNVMVTEKSNLWVGLAKETAHQLGTPITSLMGWVEYMKTVRNADEKIEPETFMDQIQGICDDMQKDLTRLSKITSRFGQIGSKPVLIFNNINDIIKENRKYFRTRLPMLKKHIEIKTNTCEMPKVPLNRDLFEWVLENLFKNSMDAIKKSEGLIEIKTEYNENEKKVRIYHIDNGEGISWEDQQNIFSPGYTTKARGWGLGLALAKRIIEDYHNGRIFIIRSQKGKGTVFCIDLPLVPPEDISGELFLSNRESG